MRITVTTVAMTAITTIMRIIVRTVAMTAITTIMRITVTTVVMTAITTTISNNNSNVTTYNNHKNHEIHLAPWFAMTYTDTQIMDFITTEYTSVYVFQSLLS